MDDSKAKNERQKPSDSKREDARMQDDDSKGEDGGDSEEDSKGQEGTDGKHRRCVAHLSVLHKGGDLAIRGPPGAPWLPPSLYMTSETLLGEPLQALLRSTGANKTLSAAPMVVCHSTLATFLGADEGLIHTVSEQISTHLDLMFTEECGELLKTFGTQLARLHQQQSAGRRGRRHGLGRSRGKKRGLAAASKDITEIPIVPPVIMVWLSPVAEGLLEPRFMGRMQCFGISKEAMDASLAVRHSFIYERQQLLQAVDALHGILVAHRPKPLIQIDKAWPAHLVSLAGVRLVLRKFRDDVGVDFPLFSLPAQIKILLNALARTALVDAPSAVVFQMLPSVVCSNHTSFSMRRDAHLNHAGWRLSHNDVGPGDEFAEGVHEVMSHVSHSCFLATGVAGWLVRPRILIDVQRAPGSSLHDPRRTMFVLSLHLLRLCASAKTEAERHREEWGLMTKHGWSGGWFPPHILQGDSFSCSPDVPIPEAVVSPAVCRRLFRPPSCPHPPFGTTYLERALEGCTALPAMPVAGVWYGNGRLGGGGCVEGVLCSNILDVAARARSGERVVLLVSPPPSGSPRIQPELARLVAQAVVALVLIGHGPNAAMLQAGAALNRPCVVLASTHPARTGMAMAPFLGVRVQVDAVAGRVAHCGGSRTKPPRPAPPAFDFHRLSLAEPNPRGLRLAWRQSVTATCSSVSDVLESIECGADEVCVRLWTLMPPAAAGLRQALIVALRRAGLAANLDKTSARGAARKAWSEWAPAPDGDGDSDRDAPSEGDTESDSPLPHPLSDCIEELADMAELTCSRVLSRIGALMAAVLDGLPATSHVPPMSVVIALPPPSVLFDEEDDGPLTSPTAQAMLMWDLVSPLVRGIIRAGHRTAAAGSWLHLGVEMTVPTTSADAICAQVWPAMLWKSSTAALPIRLRLRLRTVQNFSRVLHVAGQYARFGSSCRVQMSDLSFDLVEAMPACRIRGDINHTVLLSSTMCMLSDAWGLKLRCVCRIPAVEHAIFNSIAAQCDGVVVPPSRVTFTRRVIQMWTSRGGAFGVTGLSRVEGTGFRQVLSKKV